MPSKLLLVPVLTLLAAAPGESSPADGDVRAAVVSTLARRFAENAHPQVKGLVLHQNSIYNGARFEDVWLDR